MSKEAMKQALEALMHEMKYVLCCINLDIVPFDGDDFHEALRLGEEALSNHCEDNLHMVKQEQGEPDDLMIAYMSGLHDGKKLSKQEQGEPVAWADHGIVNWIADNQFQHAALLYEHPQQRTWVGLTDEEVEAIFQLRKGIYPTIHEVEAKLKQKNGIAQQGSDK